MPETIALSTSALSTSALPQGSLEILNDHLNLNDHLIVFTRYPEPGRTKTRLIPTLGAAGAALVQRRMTEHSLRTVAQLQQRQPVQVWLCYVGAEEARFQRWLESYSDGSEPDWIYSPQAEGDLGDRLSQAFEQAFLAGAQRVVTMGIDCPDITVELLVDAFRQLTEKDLVLGPAEDGGYYLIGLQQQQRLLFENMDWGTATVREETLAKASQAELSVGQLTRLGDVDYGTDLPRWIAHQAKPLVQPEPDSPPSGKAPLLSIIIPVRNEATALVENLPRLLTPSHLVDDAVRAAESVEVPNSMEVIVVDGGSDDASPIIAQALGARLVQTSPGRAQQMNRGAAIARGEILLFLHGDTQLPDNFVSLIPQLLEPPEVVAGAFELSIDAKGHAMRWVEWGVRQRSRYLGLPYGDQGLFLRRSDFEKLGGFADLPIMEDFEFVQRLKRRGKISIAPATVTTSGRRWQQLGVVRTTLINQLMLLGYRFGIAPERLARWYRQQA